MEHKLLLDERETEKGTHKDEKDLDEATKAAKKEKEREVQRQMEERRREKEEREAGGEVRLKVRILYFDLRHIKRSMSP